MIPQFTREEQGLDDRGIAEAQAATSTDRFQMAKKKAEQPPIRLGYAPASQNAVVDEVHYFEQLGPYLNRDPRTGRYYYHGNHSFYLARTKKGQGMDVEQRVTFEHGYRFRQYRRLWKITADGLMPIHDGRFMLDVEPFDYQASQIEIGLGAWVDPFGNKPEAPPDQWQSYAEFEEWLLEIVGHPAFGRLHLRGMLEQKKNAFRVRHFPAIEIKSRQQWYRLLEASQTPFGYRPGDHLQAYDSGWVTVPPEP